MGGNERQLPSVIQSGVPLGQLVWSTDCALLPAHLCHVPRRQHWAEPVGSPIIKKQGINVLPSLSQWQRKREEAVQISPKLVRCQERFNQMADSPDYIFECQFQTQTSQYSRLSLRLVWSHSKYKVWIWKSVISALPDQKHLNSYALLDCPLNVVLTSVYISVFCSC